MQFKSKAEIFNVDNATSLLKYIFFGYLAVILVVCFLEVGQKEHVSNVFETIVKNESSLDKLTYIELSSSKNTEFFEVLYSPKAIAVNGLLAILTVPLWVSAFLMKKKYFVRLGAMAFCASAVYAVAGIYANSHLEEYFSKANERSLVNKSSLAGKVLNVGQIVCKSENSATCSVELVIKANGNVHRVPLNIFKQDIDTRLEVEFIENTYISRLTKEKTVEYTTN